MGFRLQMLRQNLDEHYGDPEFKQSVQDLLLRPIERLDGIVGRWSAEQRHVLIKVALDLNGLLREMAGGATRRGGQLDRAQAASSRTLSLALGPVPAIWGDPYFLRDASLRLIENAIEAAAPRGRFSSGASANGAPRAARRRRDHRQRRRGCRRSSCASGSSARSRPPSRRGRARPLTAARSSATTGARSTSGASPRGTLVRLGFPAGGRGRETS